MKAPGVIVMIGKTKITAGVLAAAAVLAAGCGSGTTGQSTQQRPAPAQSTTQPQAPRPAYDTDAFIAAPTTPEGIAFDKQLRKWLKASQSGDLAAIERVTRHMVPVADAYLAVLRATNPEPKWQGIRAHQIRAITEIRNAAKDMAEGIRDSDNAEYQAGRQHLQTGMDELLQSAKEHDQVT